MNLTNSQKITLFIFDFAIPAAAAYLAFTEYPSGDWFVPAGVGGGSILLSFYLIYSFWKQHKAAEQNDPVKQKIQSMRAAGQALHVNKEEPLSEHDITLLQKELKTMLILTALVLSVIGLLFVILGEGFAKIIGIIALVAIYPLWQYQAKELNRVIQEGKKQLIRGIITKRFTTTSRSGKSKTTDYWLVLGDMKMQVSQSRYSRYAEGEAAEFHTVEYPKHITHIIRDEKLEGAGLR